jgi:hypothetical protein
MMLLIERKKSSCRISRPLLFASIPDFYAANYAFISGECACMVTLRDFIALTVDGDHVFQLGYDVRDLWKPLGFSPESR